MSEKRKATKSGTAQPELPEFMKADVGQGKEPVQPEDLAWLGDDGKLDPDRLLQEHGYNPRPPLVEILSAIIDAHPLNDGRSNSKRLEVALEALVGERRRRGMDEKDDYEILLDVAWDYFVEFWADRTAPPKVAPIVCRHVQKLSPDHPLRNMAEMDSVVRRIARKFRDQRDLLLVRVTSEHDWNRMDTPHAVGKILKQMNALGIKVRADRPVDRSHRNTKPDL